MAKQASATAAPGVPISDQLQAIVAAIADLPPHVLSGAERARILREFHRAARAEQSDRWGRFFMMNQEQACAIWEAIMTRPDIERRHQVYRAFCVISAFVEQETNQVLLDRERLAKLIRCPVSNLSGIMSSLKKLGVISRSERRRIPGVQGPGEIVYFVNAHVAWNGRLKAREEEARKVAPPALKLVHPREAAE